ncbi:hypothetical protein GCM10010234_62360 [Streptomyces hawaiiensis]
MVSSHTLWQVMQVWTQSCISLLSGVVVAGCWVMTSSQGMAGAADRRPLLSSYASGPMSTTGRTLPYAAAAP